MGLSLSKSCRLARFRRALGFTLPEVVIAGSILALFIAGSVATMAQINRWANAARLRTLAMTLAQQKADEILTAPWQVRGARPEILSAGTAVESTLTLNNDTYNSASGLSSAFTNLDTPVNATRTTVITDMPPRALRAVITVNFTYRSRAYAVNFTTLRTTDDI